MKHSFDKKIDFKKVISSIQDDYPEKRVDFHKTVFGIRILMSYFGKNWVNQSFFINHPKKDKKNVEGFNFLESDKHNHQWQERGYRLAERIYNLRKIKNIELIIENIKYGEFVPTYAEIDAATHLKRRCISFEFIKPSGIKMFDFDILIKEEIEVNCEVKHKINTPIFSRETFKKNISNANKQLPDNEPAIIILKIPESWLIECDLKIKIQDAIKPFFKRNENKIIAILLRWEVKIISDQNSSFAYMYKLFINPFYKLDTPSKNLIEKLQSNYSEKFWFSFDEIDKKYFDYQ